MKNDLWIIAMCYSDTNGVCIRKFLGSEEDAKRALFEMISDDVKNYSEDLDVMTESVDEIEESGGYNIGGNDSFYAYRSHYDYHVEATLIRLSDVQEIKGYE